LSAKVISHDEWKIIVGWSKGVYLVVRERGRSRGRNGRQFPGHQWEMHEQKATKVDDAKVPEYLCYEHVYNDGNRIWSPKDKKRLPAMA
jgi:hypothetical protein